LAIKLTTEEFVSRAREIHGANTYFYSSTKYVSAHKKVIITCPKHGDFLMTPANHTHLSKPQGCSECGNERVRKKLSSDVATFVSRAKLKHQDNEKPIYNYSKVIYKTARDRVIIICPKHGDFEQIAHHHLIGHGCPVCASEHRGIQNRKDFDTFVIESQKTHGEKYTYIKLFRRDKRAHALIRCTHHGEFVQECTNHLSGHGCPVCGNHMSKAEMEICDFIKQLGIDVVRNDRIVIKPKELDIIVPEKKFAIEYCGNYWHSELNGKTRKYHLDKLKLTEAAGYRLLTIFEDEWAGHREIVKSRIQHMLGKSERGVAARHTKIQEIDFPTARDFLNLYHIQGSTKHQKVRYGAYFNGQLISVMTFNPSRKAMGGDGKVWELVRFVTDGLSHPGIAGKLFKRFRLDYPDETIISYADRRWSDGGLYKTLGFKEIATGSPNYWYVNRANYICRKHRFGFRKQRILEMFDADPSNTEWQIMQENNYDRIWDCGSLKYMFNAKY